MALLWKAAPVRISGGFEDMALAHPPRFGALLKRQRLARGLTQEALAERAGLSAHAISDLERGVNYAPRKETMRLLADALQLSDDERAQLEASARLPAAPAGPPLLETGSSSHPTRAPLAGRTQELAQLEQHLAGSGPPLLLLAGEPGIGKSRLLDEAAERANARGWMVLAGGCYRQSRQEPYTPLLNAIADHLSKQPPALARAALQDCAWLARLLPELVEQGLFPSAPWKLPPEQERRLMFAAVERFLTNVAGPTGTLLVLDDLQWAEADALELLTVLVRRAAHLSRRVLGSYRSTEVRPGEPLAGLLADLAAAGLASQIDLAPLPEEEAATLLDSLLEDGQARDAFVVEQVLRRGGGVPFFLVSCAQALRQQTSAGIAAEPLPWTVAQSIRQRVAALPVAAQDLLGASAVIGRRASGTLLQALALQKERETLEALEAACQARLLEEQEERYQFPYDLIREVILADLSAARRRLLHRMTAEALEQQRGEPPVEQLAYHYRRAGMLEKASLYLHKAGERALATYANAEAEGIYRELVEVFAKLGLEASAARAQERLAEALQGQARYTEALKTLEEVLPAYRRADDLEEQAHVLVKMGFLHGQSGTAETGIALLETWLHAHAESALSARGRGRLTLALSRLYRTIGRYVDAIKLAEQAITCLQSEGDAALGLALWQLGSVLALLNRLEEAIPQLEAALPLVERARDASALFNVLGTLDAVYATRGELHTSRDYTERELVLAGQLGNPYLMAMALHNHGYHAFLRGDWRLAREELEQAITPLRQADRPWGTTSAFFSLGVLLMAQGHWEAAAPYYEEGLALAQERAAWWLAQSELAERDLISGQPQHAYARLAPLLVEQANRELTPLEPLTMLAWAHLEREEHDQAQHLLDQIIPQAHQHHLRPVLAAALLVQARLAARHGHWQESRQALDETLRLAQAIQNPYLEAKALYAAGSLALQQGDSVRARESLAQALAILGHLGERLYAVVCEKAVQRLAASS
jgi:tetratricopeptide (TPR) repeat protein/transcriptional regulator with XRE-family HTH domain